MHDLIVGAVIVLVVLAVMMGLFAWSCAVHNRNCDGNCGW